MVVPQVDVVEETNVEAEYSFVQDEEQFHVPRTPYQAIRLLHHSATESEKDDIVQKFFNPVIVNPSSRPDTLSLPGLKGHGMDYNAIPTYRDGFFKGNPLLHPEIKVEINGVSGAPIPYSLKSDVYVTATLLVCFFVASYVVSRSLNLLKEQLKNFFYNRDRKQIFTLKSESEMKNQVFVILLVCFLLSLLFLTYTETNMTSVFNQVSPYLLLGGYMVVLGTYYLCKYVLFGIVNWTFFSPQKRSQWLNSYNLIILIKATCYFVLALLIVYFDLTFENSLISFLSVYILSEILVIFKAKQIFFIYKFGFLHLFLYFCTLEVMPVFLVWKALIIFNEYLIEFI